MLKLALASASPAAEAEAADPAGVSRAAGPGEPEPPTGTVAVGSVAVSPAVPAANRPVSRPWEITESESETGPATRASPAAGSAVRVAAPSAKGATTSEERARRTSSSTRFRPTPAIICMA